MLIAVLSINKFKIESTLIENLKTVYDKKEMTTGVLERATNLDPFMLENVMLVIIR